MPPYPPRKMGSIMAVRWLIEALENLMMESERVLKLGWIARGHVVLR